MSPHILVFKYILFAFFNSQYVEEVVSNRLLIISKTSDPVVLQEQMGNQSLFDAPRQECALLDSLEVDCALVIIVINFEQWGPWHDVLRVQFFFHRVPWVHVVLGCVPDKLTWSFATIREWSR